MQQKILDKFPHILIKDTARAEPYTSPSSGGKTFKLPVRQRETHGQKLLRQFDRIRVEAKDTLDEQKAFGIDAGNGVYIQFESDPDFELKFESLEMIRSKIELLAVQEKDNKTYATVFVPEGKLQVLEKKITDYLEKNTKKGAAKNKELVESISAIQRAALEALWTDERKVLPVDDNEFIWWEVWLRSGDEPQSVVDFFKGHAARLNITVSPKEIIHFPDRTVIAVHGTKAQMMRSMMLLNTIAELRKAKETADFFTSMDSREQREWIENLMSQLIDPSPDCPNVCILDTGINNEHPLLSSYLNPTDMHAYNPVWNVTDHHGHGTEMAGLALYGDLTEAFAQIGPFELSHRIESVKIKPPKRENPPHLYGDITAEAIARAEIQNPNNRRVVCMAVSATDDRDRGRPSSWSARIDNLAAGADDDVKRLVIIAAGNTPVEERHNYPHSNIADFGIHDPGQSWNAITVGANTQKDQIDPQEYPGWRLVAPFGDLSPSSSTSMTWQRPWPIKPDIVMEGGNIAINPAAGKADYVDSLGLLTTNHLHAVERPLVISGDTSAATALASRMAARLQAQYPEYWPETIRALMIHSA